MRNQGVHHGRDASKTVPFGWDGRGRRAAGGTGPTKARNKCPPRWTASPLLPVETRAPCRIHPNNMHARDCLAPFRFNLFPRFLHSSLLLTPRSDPSILFALSSPLCSSPTLFLVTRSLHLPPPSFPPRFRLLSPLRGLKPPSPGPSGSYLGNARQTAIRTLRSPLAEIWRPDSVQCTCDQPWSERHRALFSNIETVEADLESSLHHLGPHAPTHRLSRSKNQQPGRP